MLTKKLGNLITCRINLHPTKIIMSQKNTKIYYNCTNKTQIRTVIIIIIIIIIINQC